MNHPSDGPMLLVRCWGTRGSLPSPGAHSIRFGGNTSCVEVCRGERRFILDAGSGIRPLGERLVAHAGPSRPIDLFLSHFHWDHIQGLPFFGPLYDPRTVLTIHGAPQDGRDVRELIAGQMQPVYFPVPFDELAARLDFRHVGAEPFETGDLQIAAFRARHPGTTCGYRIRCGDIAVAYFPDNELVGGQYPLPADWYRELCSFLGGVDLLLHDAMYTDAEYGQYQGWGHSTAGQAVRLAEESGVRRLLLFHHAPERTDGELERMVDELRSDLARRGVALELGAAAEGEELAVEERTS